MSKEKTKKPIFVVQKHDASHLHYDFRLQIGKTLKSWAVPKGPSLRAGVKRLAVEVPDHPLSYATFEGTIAQGNYGAGEVTIWDHGTFENSKKDDDGKAVSLLQSHKNGTIEIELHGKKMKGTYALVRTKLRGKTQWLLMKMSKKKSK
jgi:DNA ligase D-like protein (predicted 3'-phosphoesterase)